MRRIPPNASSCEEEEELLELDEEEDVVPVEVGCEPVEVLLVSVLWLPVDVELPVDWEEELEEELEGVHVVPEELEEEESEVTGAGVMLELDLLSPHPARAAPARAKANRERERFSFIRYLPLFPPIIGEVFSL